MDAVPAFRLAEASRLEYLQDFPEAFGLLEHIIKDETSNGPTLLLAMAYEQAANLVKRWTKSDFLSSSFAAGSLQTYREFGALAKCTQLEKFHSTSAGPTAINPSRLSLPPTPGVVGSIESGSDSSGSNPVTASDGVDLATLLSAVSTWQRETSASRVGASLISTLMKSMVRLVRHYLTLALSMSIRVHDMAHWRW